MKSRKKMLVVGIVVSMVFAGAMAAMAGDFPCRHRKPGFGHGFLGLKAMLELNLSESQQTQVLGISTGGTVVRDEHCEKLKMARAMNAIGLKTVAAGVLAQDPVAFKAMWQSGVYPPINGKLGEEARKIWIENPDKLPEGVTLTALLLQEELDNIAEVKAGRIPLTKWIDGHKVCRASNGNYYMSC